MPVEFEFRYMIEVLDAIDGDDDPPDDDDDGEPLPIPFLEAA